MVWVTKKINDLKYNYMAIKYLYNEEKNSKSNVGLLKKIWCLLHGFSSSKFELYNFKDNNYKLYLSDFKRRKTAKINGPYSLVINDKGLFDKVFASSNITAKIYGKIIKGKVLLDNNMKSNEDFIELIKRNRSLIIKKFRGGGGKDIYRVSYLDETLYLDDLPITKEKFYSFIERLSNHLIMEHLTQTDYSNAIYPRTINSIRIITMIDPFTNEVFIPIAIHKFGSEKTKPVDNVWKGGMTAQIDLNSGYIGKSAYHHENNNKIEWMSTHPDTNKKIEGTKIPNWKQIMERMSEIAKSEDNLKYVGWDVVMTDNGLKVIEGNNYSDVNILQIHQPLLKDERVKRFYRYYGIIK